jgi:hypothetical protein
MQKYDRARHATDRDTKQHIYFSCWITKATDTHSEYVILIALPQHQWLHEHIPKLRYMYTVCLVYLLSPVKQILGQSFASGHECFLPELLNLSFRSILIQYIHSQLFL